MGFFKERMRPMNVLDEKNIRLNVKLDAKEDAIKAAGAVLVENGYVQPEYVNDMLAREEVACTYIGNHVGIPHGISKSEERIKESGISLLQIPEGVDYDGEIAYVVIGIAGKNDEHIEMLGKMAVTCSDAANIEKIRYATSAAEILDVFENAEI